MFNRSPAFFFFLLIGSSTLSAVIERTVERSFPVGQQARVKVDTFYGGIQVKSTDQPEVKVVVRQSIDASTPAAADGELREISLVIEQQPDGAVALKATYKKAVRWTWQKWPPIGLQVELTVPAACDLDLVTREGGVNLGNLKGRVNIRTMQGRVFAGEIDGPLTIWSAQGDIAVTACQGELHLTARGGNIIVGRTFGNSEISGVGGVVEVQAAHAALHASSNGSDMKIGFVYPLSGDSELHASGGDIGVTFETKIAATLDVRASTFSEISSRELPLQVRGGALGTSRLQADLNGGGPRVEIRSSGGSVRLLGVPLMPQPR